MNFKLGGILNILDVVLLHIHDATPSPPAAQARGWVTAAGVVCFHEVLFADSRFYLLFFFFIFLYIRI